jgi:hypothetical protein
MKRSAFILAALLLAGLAFAASAREAGADLKATANEVVVDPMDLRQPIPNPELGLTGKYDGQVVLFTGVPHALVSKKTNKVSFELRYDIVEKVPVKGKKPRIVVKETIVVPVTFANDEKELVKDLERLRRARKPALPITVKGTGSVTGETLFISDAIIAPDGRLDPPRR